MGKFPPAAGVRRVPTGFCKDVPTAPPVEARPGATRCHSCALNCWPAYARLIGRSKRSGGPMITLAPFRPKLIPALFVILPLCGLARAAPTAEEQDAAAKARLEAAERAIVKVLEERRG